jgi:hypothetical protein
VSVNLHGVGWEEGVVNSARLLSWNGIDMNGQSLFCVSLTSASLVVLTRLSKGW